MRVKLRILLALILFCSCITPPANSIMNGTAAVGSEYVVTMLFGDENPSSYCTGAYLRPRVVVTAAHCVIRAGGRAPELVRPIEQFYVSQAGVDWKSEEAKRTRVRVLRIWTEPDFFNRWEPEKGLMETQVNDVAFLFLEKELAGLPVSRAATKDEIEQYRLGQTGAFHLGYGCLGEKDLIQVPNDGKPYLVEGIVGTTNRVSHIPIYDRYLSVLYPPGKSLCPGDSGSPLLLRKGDEVIYLATLFAGGGWQEISRGATSTRGNALATVLWPFIPALDTEWAKFLADEAKIREQEQAALKAKEETELELERIRLEAIRDNTYYLDQAFCHARGINAELQGFINGSWQVVAPAKGWRVSSACFGATPVRPWTVVDLPNITQLRWRYWFPGSFDVLSNVFPSNIKRIELATPSPSPSATPISSPTPTPTPSASPLATKTMPPISQTKVATKKVTINCIKGNKSMRVTGVKPQCPTGYKRK